MSTPLSDRAVWIQRLAVGGCDDVLEVSVLSDRAVWIQQEGARTKPERIIEFQCSLIEPSGFNSLGPSKNPQIKKVSVLSDRAVWIQPSAR